MRVRIQFTHINIQEAATLLHLVHVNFAGLYLQACCGGGDESAGGGRHAKQNCKGEFHAVAEERSAVIESIDRSRSGGYTKIAIWSGQTIC